MVRVGISGWSYANWRGDFYPQGLAPGEMLGWASRRLSTIEINATFYGPQPAERFRRWRDTVPPGFLFSVKGPRQATHALGHGEVEPVLARFFAGPVTELGETLGPILWQLPARHVFQEASLARFLGALPAGRRHALEARHESFRDPRCLALLERHRVALVLADAPRWPTIEASTGDFTYVRLHGAERLYVSGYDAAALDAWAARVRAWAAAGRDVFVYFNNTMRGRAPHDAVALAERIAG